MNDLTIEQAKIQLSTLINDRKPYLSTITRIDNALKERSIVNATQLLDRQERLNNAQQEWMKLQKEINALLQHINSPELIAKQSEQVQIYTDKIEDIKDGFSDLIAEFAPRSIPAESQPSSPNLFQFQTPQASIQTQRHSNNEHFTTSQSTNLRRIEIEKFNGDYLKWTSFKDMFDTSITNNPTLTDILRFQHLKSLLEGKPLQLIQNRRITDNGYTGALNALVEAYDKPHLIVDSLLNKLLKLPILSSRNATNIQNLVATITEIDDGLNAVGPQWNTREVLFCFLVYSKLDPQTKYRWDEINNRQVPTIDRLHKFLVAQTEALERSQFGEHHISKSSTNETSKQYKERTTTDRCICCTNQTHVLHQCDLFKAKTVQERRTFSAENKICFNCLKPNHTAPMCNNPNRCRDCNKPHHSLLHIPITSTQVMLTAADYLNQDVEDAQTSL